MTLRKMKEGNANFPLSISATEMDPFSLHHPQSVRTHGDRDIEMLQFQFFLIRIHFGNLHRSLIICRCPNGFLGLSLNDRIVLFLVTLSDKAVSAG